MSWWLVNTLTGVKFGVHKWFMSPAIFLYRFASIQKVSPSFKIEMIFQWGIFYEPVMYKLIKYFNDKLCKLTLASKSNRYESSLVSASESDMISPTYSQIKVPFGMFCIERIPQPIPYTLNACSRTVIPCCNTRLWQVLTLHLEDQLAIHDEQQFYLTIKFKQFYWT